MAAEKANTNPEIEAVVRYSVFTTSERWCIVALVFKINLTITTYMAVATIAPTLVGSTADVLGRRPIYMVALTLYLGATLFIDIYKLDQWQAGLIYLPFGLGGTISTFFSGSLLDNAYRQTRTKRGLSTDKVAGDDLDNFAIEKARLSVIWIPMLVTICSVLAFGWVLDYHQVSIWHMPSALSLAN
ncbi:hypothetical protein AYL99_07283 [Fonsecaea erecta]|uniref:Major facilitator superfamily (MFS) profile domain-containing protein n=1 Tax=Fonsecaea erecta TaxID=1367422 RepID=A0A178ZG75_9EURO|nr:hypothetical protein AYL99_07283 [Fonsecaea erecta]OAP58193.1 hypothetical protein AYL99_07283 [Fonsecaea erecta]